MPENHVFISYAHLDNKPLPESPKGWVSYFDEALTNLLSQKMGSDAKVWRDPQMARNAIFNEEIFNNLLQSSTLVSVVSPRYIQSKYCLDELEEFCKKPNLVGTKSRVFKVVKTLVQLEDMPEIFRDTNGFYFYKIDEETKIPRELGLDFGTDLKQEFFLKVSDLAYDIAKLLELIKRPQPQLALPKVIEPETVINSQPLAVYLSKTSSDFQKERDNIRRDLLDRGYQVLPPSDAIEPKTTDEYKQFVRDNVQKCSLSVHLIGKNYGESPEDGDESYIHLQSMVAADRDKDSDFCRIVWLPKDVNTSQSRHQKFVDEIWNSTAKGVEVLIKPLEEIKTNILDALNRIAKPVLLPKPKTTKPSVLVLYDKTDLESASNLETYIKEKGFSLRSVAKYLSGDPKELLEAQNDYLRSCDAVLIYWNKSRDSWVWSMLRQLQKIFGDGREEMFLGQALFADAGNNTEDFTDETEAEFVTNYRELDEYLEQVKNAFQSKIEKRGQK